MKILLLASQHGDELLGDYLHTHLKIHYSHLLQHISFKIANPKAYKLGVRYIDSDLNRSYNKGPATYERRRASYIKRYIREQAFDLILDLHTTVCIQPPCMIVHDIYETNKQFLRASSIERIVCIKDPIIHTTLAGHNKHTVAIEIANTDITPTVLDSLCKDLERYILHKQRTTQKIVYTVDSLLLKTEVSSEEAKQLVNFQISPAGYIPILVGENSYKKNTAYLGFKATKATRITV